ncbi:MAG: CvpA family protein [Thermoplasmataceae archaeon]
MRHKPLIAKQKYRLNRRLIIFSVVFVFFTFITAILGQISMWNGLPQYTPLPNWLFYPLVVSFFIAFIDIILWFGILLSLEALGIIAVVYAFSFTGLYHFSLSYFGNNTFTAILSFILLIINVIWYFDLFAPIHALLTRTYWTSPEDRARKKYEKKFKSKKTEPNGEAEEREKTTHTKEELARLLNLWQQKYAQATTDEGRKEANEMIMKYQTELEKMKTKNGTTPERAKLTQGGDNE